MATVYPLVCVCVCACVCVDVDMCVAVIMNIYTDPPATLIDAQVSLLSVGNHGNGINTTESDCTTSTAQPKLKLLQTMIGKLKAEK